MYQARLRRLAILLVAPFVVIFVRLVWLQVVTASSHRKKAVESLQGKEIIPGKGGTISDRKGRPLAWDEGGFDLDLEVGYWEAGTAVGCVTRVLRDLERLPAEGVPAVLRAPDQALAALLELPARAVSALPGKARDERDVRRLAVVFGCSRKHVAAELARAGGALTIDGLWIASARAAKTTVNRAAVLERMRAEAAAIAKLDGMLGAGGAPLGLAALIEEFSQDADADIREREMLRLGAEERDREEAIREAQVDAPLRRRKVARLVDRAAAFEVFLHPSLYPGFEPVVAQTRTTAPDAPVPLLAGLAPDVRERIAAKPGHAVYNRSASGEPRETLEYEPPIPGRDVELTIDLDVQRAAQAALGDRVGAAVVVSCRTGEVLALASNPTYGLDDVTQHRAALASAPGDPLYPRAFRLRRAGSSYPGSTFKVVTTVAALEDVGFEPSTTFECSGYLHDPQHFRCTGTHGAQSLHGALVRSCNVYFYNLGERVGGERLAAWGARFGFGRKTGVEIAEDAGILYSPAPIAGLEWTSYPKLGVRKPAGSWQISDSRFLAIGQVDVEATPLQVCRMIAAIGLGGRLPKLHLVRRVGESDGTWGPPVAPELEDLGISARTMRVLQDALRGVVFEEGGTAYGKGLDRLDAGGKSGTAEWAVRGAKQPDHAWFACYAPIASPQVAVTVFLDSAGEHGGAAAAPLAVPILEAYFASLQSRPEGEESR
jgi:cell division protein FtsI/penicillin-binding protein 2